MEFHNVDGLQKATVLVDNRYLREHCGLYKGHTVWIKRIDYYWNNRINSYQVVRPNAFGELTFWPHELLF